MEGDLYQCEHGVSGAALDELGRWELGASRDALMQPGGSAPPQTHGVGELELTDSPLSRKIRQKTMEVDQVRKYLNKRQYFLLLKMR